jgi:aspartyl-tRNA(Asn)/glutamyl-tRNA(Gln) amidotransferase subunit A
VTGLKPTFGRVSQDGVIPLSTTFDCVGPLTRSAHDAAIILQVLAGYRPDDPTTIDVPTPDFGARCSDGVDGLTIGVARRHHLDHPALDAGVAEAFEAALAELEGQGARLVDVTLPFYDQVLTANLVTFVADALAYHHRLLREQWDAYQRTTRMTFASGALFTSGDYVRAQKVRRAVRRDVARLFERVDVIASPTTATPAPVADADLNVAQIMQSIFTPYWSVTGNPAISIPMGFSGGLPVALQLAGRMFDEPTVVRVADAYQQATDWHRREPAIAEEANRV